MQKLIEKLKWSLVLIGSILGALGGQGIKQLRRITLPIILSFFAVLCLQSWYGLILGTFGLWASLGYGIPDGTSDDGSALGQFWFSVWNENHLLADIFTRGTIGVGMCLSGLVCPILNLAWFNYFIGCVCILMGQCIFSYRNLGVIYINNGELLISDLINYGFIFLGYSIMLM